MTEKYVRDRSASDERPSELLKDCREIAGGSFRDQFALGRLLSVP